jgi:imidazolonepropionase-like amidohydrolase
MKFTYFIIVLSSLFQLASGCKDNEPNIGKDEILAMLDKKLINTDSDFLIKNVNLITMETDEVMTEVDVYIKDQKIEKIANTGGPNNGYTVIDGTDKFLLPGLADMHVHFIDDPEYNKYNAFLFLANGVTTIRIMWGVDGNISMRDKINSREFPGPRMFIASSGFNGSVPLWPGTILTSSTEEVRTKVKEFKAMGYDYIKIYGNLSKEHFDVLIDEASKVGLKPIGHLPQVVELNYAMNQKQYSIEHLGGFSQLSVSSTSFSDALATSLHNGTWHCPTLIVQNRSSLLVSQYKSEEYSSLISPRWRIWYEYALAQPPSNSPSAGHQMRLTIVNEMNKAGVNIISGTDMRIRYIYPGISLHEELGYYVRAGFTPYQALKTSTKNVSLFLQDEGTGTINVGKRADLVLLSSNPLINISNISTIDGVIANGTWFSKADISDIKDLIKKLYK